MLISGLLPSFFLARFRFCLFIRFLLYAFFNRLVLLNCFSTISQYELWLIISFMADSSSRLSVPTGRSIDISPIVRGKHDLP